MLVPRLFAIAAAVLVTISASSKEKTLMDRDEAARWQRDLEFVVQTVTTGHAEPFHATSEHRFRRSVSQLREAIPRLPRHAIILRMARLVASIGDGHTRLPWPWDPAELGFHSLPVRFEVFSDGVFVVAASAVYSDLVGARVLEVGRVSIDRALRSIAPIVSSDNRFGVDRIAKRLLAVPEVLDALEIAPLGETVPFVLEKDGQRRAASLPVTTPSAVSELLEFHRINGGAPPLHRTALEEFYWMSTLEEGRTICAHINTVSNQPGHPTLPEFCDELLAAVDHGAERVIIDLRHNAGGSRELMLPCVDGLAARQSINRPDRLFVVVGNETFSAALWAALDLKNRTRAAFLGEPTAGRPNFYGETQRSETPEHHIPFTWASRMNWRTDRNDRSEALVPDRVIRESFADYAAGRDPVVEAILSR